LNTTLHGLWPALMTPLDEHQGIDTTRGIAHARSLLEAGCDGITLFGTTGEGPAFSVAERIGFVDTLIDAGIPAARIIVCTAAASNVDQIALSKHALACDCAAVLLLPPFFFRNPGEQGIIDAVAEVIDGVADARLAVILYHIPQLSSVHFTPAVIRALVQRYPQQIFAIKDSAGNLEHALELIRTFPELKIFVGAEEHIAPAMQIGGAGSVCGLANLAPHLMRRVISNPAQLSTQDAAVMSKLLALVGNHSFVGVFKTVLSAQKNDTAWLRVRAPLSALDDTARQTVLAGYEELKKELQQGATTF
jgi:4-hydroxy-tetrahydrodipicolinate synthase